MDAIKPSNNWQGPLAPKTISVPEAGRIYFDLSKNAAYAAAARGQIPVVRIGRKLRVPIVAIERQLEGARFKSDGKG